MSGRIETITNSETAPRSVEPQRARAVFANEDFELIRTAILHYLEAIKGEPEAIKYSNLYHRLGRLS